MAEERIVSRPLDEEGRKTWDRLFGVVKNEDGSVCSVCTAVTVLHSEEEDGKA